MYTGIAMLGLPELDIEKAIGREHSAEEKFTAWNNGEGRETR